ncbi:ATP-binding protein [uncultured Acidaminococcus sp.]|uniref:ATP-binding protein n=1 Tax=uncultured Acidaminococcus sp. TaxID=352152 RepID=UPI00259A68D3|nr:AAA family ATPase [uncultured Acidaminococcus sp.]
MKLLKLKLENFKGVREFILDADGKNVAVYGTNGSGKSTLMDAFTWLLFDKNSHWESKFGIKTLGSDGKTIPKLEHTVTAILDDGGQEVLLSKTLKERWVKARGVTEPVYNGNTTTYMAGSPDAPIPVSAAQYKKTVTSILDESLFKMLSDPLYFNEKMKTEDRRKALVEMVGEITDEDVVAAHSELKEVPAILNGIGIDDCRRGLKLAQKKVGQERDGIPERVDELSRQLPKWTAEQADNARQSVSILPAEIEKIQTEIAQAKAPEASSKALEIEMLKNKLSEAKAVWEKAKDSRDKQFQDNVAKVKGELQSTMFSLQEANCSLNVLLQKKKTCDAAIADRQESLQALREAFVAEKKNPFSEPPINDICPTCGQQLPAESLEKLQAERQEHEAMFNQAKAEHMKEINDKGKALAASLQEEKSSLEAVQEKIDQKRAEVENFETTVADLRQKLKTMHVPDPTEAEDKLKALVEAAEAKLKEAQKTPEPQQVDVTPFRKKLESIQERWDRAKTIVADVDHGNFLNKRIQELLQSDGQLAQRQADLERKLALLDDFSKAKMDMVNEKCNKEFEHVRWTMFRPNVTNSGYEACCEATWDGVPYKDLNTGCRINAGLDVIRTLAKRAGKTVPIFLDNAESVVKLLPTDAQVIRLVVNDADKTLRVEKEA